MSRQSGKSRSISVKWTPARHAKFSATMRAKKEAGQGRTTEVLHLVMVKRVRRLVIEKIKTDNEVGPLETAVLGLTEILLRR